MPFLSQIIGHPPDHIAIIDSEQEHKYESLVQQSRLLASSLKSCPLNNNAVNERPRIAFFADRQASSMIAILAIWLADGIAVPLDPMMSLSEWQWRLDDLKIQTVVYPSRLRAEAHYLAQLVSIHLVCVEANKERCIVPLKLGSPDDSAVILFSSGTDSHPKPVVHSFSSLSAQMKALSQALDWQPGDHLLHVLPLASTHGLIHGLLCSMAAGACCRLVDTFKTDAVWNLLASGDTTLFTAVPTIYQYLIDAWHKTSDQQQIQWQHGLKHLRHAIVGSSPLMPELQEQWSEISGQPLWFRYGKTECGMILYNSMAESHQSGITGIPLPGINLRLVDDTGSEITTGGPGELEVRSAQLFKEYYGKAQLSRDAFNHGWYRTGELAIKRESGDYQLLGHRNLDIIESGGYRVSAQEVEAMLDCHPGVSECAVLGTPCDRWGEAICACIVPKAKPLDLSELRDWLCPQLPSYKLPTRLSVLEQMPRTSVGAIDKPGLKRDLSHIPQKLY